jgi:hypothetical protein
MGFDFRLIQSISGIKSQNKMAFNVIKVCLLVVSTTS